MTENRRKISLLIDESLQFASPGASSCALSPDSIGMTRYNIGAVDFPGSENFGATSLTQIPLKKNARASLHSDAAASSSASSIYVTTDEN